MRVGEWIFYEGNQKEKAEEKAQFLGIMSALDIIEKNEQCTIHVIAMKMRDQYPQVFSGMTLSELVQLRSIYIQHIRK